MPLRWRDLQGVTSNENTFVRRNEERTLKMIKEDAYIFEECSWQRSMKSEVEVQHAKENKLLEYNWRFYQE